MQIRTVNGGARTVSRCAKERTVNATHIVRLLRTRNGILASHTARVATAILGVAAVVSSAALLGSDSATAITATNTTGAGISADDRISIRASRSDRVSTIAFDRNRTNNGPQAPTFTSSDSLETVINGVLAHAAEQRLAAEEAARRAAEEATRVAEEATRVAEEAARVAVAEEAARAAAAVEAAAASAGPHAYKDYARGRIGAGEFSCLERLWGRESGWNPVAQNPTSTAFGIAQFLNSTWAGTGIAKTSNGYRQVDAGLIYLNNRYGGPCGGWAHSQAAGWY